jgi:anti-sigma B factor antagonist
MASIESLSVTVSRRGLLAFARRDGARTVVWLRGEHDVSTVAALSETMARAIARDDADLVVDLSEVQFMGAATVGVIVRARELLELRSRSLTLRSPSRCARRILDLCGHADLLDPRRVDATPAAGAAGALGTWVAVPATDRIVQRADASAPQRSSAPGLVPVARVIAAKVSSVDAHRRADEPTTDVAGRGGP